MLRLLSYYTIGTFINGRKGLIPSTLVEFSEV